MRFIGVQEYYLDMPYSEEARLAVPTVTDQELIERTRQGDNTAFVALWQRYERQVLALCRHYLDTPYRDPATDAQDLATETFIRSLHNLDRYEDRSQAGLGFETWLLEIARRLCLKFLARQRRRSRWQEAIPAQDRADSPASAEAVQGLVEEREVLRLVVQAINALPALYRAPFKLSLEECSQKEIAETLGISVDTAAKRIQRARRLLQPRLKILLGLDPDVARTRRGNQPARISWHGVEQALTEIIGDYHIVNIDLPGGGQIQLCLRVDRGRAGPEQQEPGNLRGPRASVGAWKKSWELAETRYHRGQWREAREEYRQVLAANPRCFEAALRLGEMLCEEQKTGEALQVYHAALQQQPPTSLAVRIQAHLLAAEGRVEAAVEAFRYAIELAPEEKSNYYGLHRVLARLSRFEAQLENLARLRQVDPNDVFAYQEAYTPCARLVRWDIARPLLEKAVAIDPHDPMAIKHLFQVRMNLGLRDEETQALAERLVRLAPDFAQSWSELAWIYAETGRSQQSLAILHTFQEAHPNNAEIHAALTWRYHYLGQETEARAHAQRAYALAPHSWHVCWTMMMAHASPNTSIATATALQLGEEIAARFPQDVFVIEAVARFLAGWGQEARALEYGRRALALNPSSPYTVAIWAGLLAQFSRWEQAAEAYRQLITMPGGRNAGMLSSLGLALTRLQAPEAEEIMAEARAQAQTAPDWLAIGLTDEQCGRLKSAEAALRRCLQLPSHIASTHRTASEVLDRLLLLMAASEPE